MEPEIILVLADIGFLSVCIIAATKVLFSQTVNNDFEDISISSIFASAAKGKFFLWLGIIWAILVFLSIRYLGREGVSLTGILLMSPIFYLGAIYSKLRSGMIAGFAQENGFNYSPGGSLSQELFSDPLPPHLNIGYSHKITDIVYWVSNSNRIRFYNFTYTTGSGKNRSTHSFAVCEIDHTIQTPHIDLEPRDWGSLSAINDNLTMESLRLEGEFGDRYNFFVPKGFERQILEIFTPDVMANFLDLIGKKSPNFEFWNGKIFTTINWELTNKDELRWMVQAGKWLQKNLVPKLNSLHG